MDKSGAKQFAKYVNEKRDKRGLSMNQLCDRLCSERAAFYIEQGEREPGRMLREAILERLGVGAEDYECYLGWEEYAQWKMQHTILHHIAWEEMDQAEELLEVYRNTYCPKEVYFEKDYTATESSEGDGRQMKRRDETDMDKLPEGRKLERQFLLAMLAQIRAYYENREGTDPGKICGENTSRTSLQEEVRALLREAAGLTMPALESRKIADLVLSVKELNLVLETEHYREEGERPARYREVVEYLESGRIDRRGKAKLYAKAVYFLCRSLMKRRIGEKGTPEEGMLEEGIPEERVLELLKYCNRALKILRENGRMYFLWEILDMRERLFGRLEELPFRRHNPETRHRLRQENMQWKQVLEAVYAEFGVPKETFDYCYLYVSKGVYCTNDVIRIRSEMFGLKGKALCGGVCSIKTLRRILKRTTTPQRAIVRELFEKLGLSEELVKTELVTGVPEARELMERLREHINKNQWEEVERLLERIKQLVPMDIACNRQTLLRKEILLRWEKGMIDKQEYCTHMREALEITLPYEAFLKPGEKYLTHEEQSCIQNLMQGMDRESEEFLTCMQRLEEIYQPFTDTGEIETVSGMYEFIMKFVGSMRGNMGQFDKADRYDSVIIMGCLRTRRLWSIHDFLYDRWWNFAERRKKGIPTDIVLDDEEELNKCILLSQLAQSKTTLFYQKKLKSIKDEK